ncbi:hypothetical protein LUZ60_014000 [Juncus effusus]|nr:hypothetical protein LUZ60_014000 [Juncus effusus]
MAGSGRVSLIVAASVGAVEALKDQVGLCRWNYALRCVKNQMRGANSGAISQFKKVSEKKKGLDEKARRSEESLRTVMYLSCWGPN